jgi:hypothetical protein
MPEIGVPRAYSVYPFWQQFLLSLTVLLPVLGTLTPYPVRGAGTPLYCNAVELFGPGNAGTQGGYSRSGLAANR